MSHRVITPARRRSLAIAFLLIVAALGGCSDVDRPDDGHWRSSSLPRTSPANLLRNLQEAYAKRNLAEYESLLAKDFVFGVSAEDSQDPGIPDSLGQDLWGHDSEVRAHAHMFDADLVQTLTVTFAAAKPVWDPADRMYTVLASNVNLLIYGATPAHPTELREYRVTNGSEKFWFRKNGWFSPGTRDSVWTIVKCLDAKPSGQESWGSIKVLFQ
jgi:hypothetical protein